MALADVEQPRVHELTRDEGRVILDQQARRYLNMSGDAFVRAWNAGTFDSDPETRRRSAASRCGA